MSGLSASERRTMRKVLLIARSDALRDRLAAELRTTFSVQGLATEAAGWLGRALRLPSVWWTAASLLLRWLRRRRATRRR